MLKIFLSQGKISAQGTYNELVSQGIDFVSLMVKEHEDDSKDVRATAQQGVVVRFFLHFYALSLLTLYLLSNEQYFKQI